MKSNSEFFGRLEKFPMSLQCAAKILNVSTRSLYRAESKGLLRFSRPFGAGSKVYLSVDDLENFLRKGLSITPDYFRGTRLAKSRRKKRNDRAI